MRFAYTILYVANVLDTVDFYERAFGFRRKFVTPEGDYGELRTDTTTLAFASLTLGKSNLPNGFIASTLDQRPFGIELAFTTENIIEDFATALSAGATQQAPITKKPWGQQVGYLRDLNGFLIELCTPMQQAQ